MPVTLCPTCKGSGRTEPVMWWSFRTRTPYWEWRKCDCCYGKGYLTRYDHARIALADQGADDGR